MCRLFVMLLSRLLLTVLVCVTLVLNGSGVAVAGMHMQHDQTKLMDVMPASPIVHTDCMEHATAATEMNGSSPQEGLDPDTINCCSEPPCCNGSVCAFVCAAGAAATLDAPILDFQLSPQTLDVLANPATHPTPALRVRYRPPIV